MKRWEGTQRWSRGQSKVQEGGRLLFGLGQTGAVEQQTNDSMSQYRKRGELERRSRRSGMELGEEEEGRETEDGSKKTQADRRLRELAAQAR